MHCSIMVCYRTAPLNGKNRPTAVIEVQMFQRLLLVKRVFKVDIETCRLLEVGP
jgi:hypothetical protein